MNFGKRDDARCDRAMGTACSQVFSNRLNSDDYLKDRMDFPWEYETCFIKIGLFLHGWFL